MTEDQFSTKFLARNRGYSILFLISEDYTNYSSINTMYENGLITTKTFSSTKEIIEHINSYKLNRILIDASVDLDFNTLNVNDIDIPDFRIFFINNKNKNIKLNIKSDSYLSINTLEKIDNYYFVGSIIQVNNLNKKLCINISKVHGFGTFTNKKIKKDEVLFKLFGEKIDIKDKELSLFKGEWNALSENLLLLRKERTTYGFINHSRTPNCYIDTTDLTVKAIRDINANDEIFLDYRKEPLPKKYKSGHGSTYL